MKIKYFKNRKEISYIKLLDDKKSAEVCFLEAYYSANNKKMRQYINVMFKEYNINYFLDRISIIFEECVNSDFVNIVKYIYNRFSNFILRKYPDIFEESLLRSIHLNSKKTIHFLIHKKINLDIDIANSVIRDLADSYPFDYHNNILKYILEELNVDITFKHIDSAIYKFNFNFIKDVFRIRKYMNINTDNHIIMKTALHVDMYKQVRGDGEYCQIKFPFYMLGYHVNYLVRIGAEYRFEDDYPLRISCAKGHLSLTKYFLSLGCDYTLKNWWCWRISVKNNYKHIVYELDSYNKKTRQLLVPYSMLMQYVVSYKSIYEYLKEQNEKQQERVRKLILNNVNILYSDVVGIIVNYL